MPQGERLPEAWKVELGPDWAQVWHNWRHMAEVVKADILDVGLAADPMPE